MKTVYNKLPETVRTRALADKPKQRVNPYLYDVREDEEIRTMLRDAADFGDTVKLPVGVYLCARHESVQNCYAGYDVYVLVNPNGKTQHYEGYLADSVDGKDWHKWVQKFLGIPQDAVKKTKKKTAKKTAKKTKKKTQTRTTKAWVPMNSFEALRDR